MTKRILETLSDEQISVADAIHKIALDVLEVDLEKEQVDKVASQIGISDLIALDAAHANRDVRVVQDLFGRIITMEYSMGRNVTSAASARKYSGGVSDRPVAPADSVNSDDDQEQDADKEMLDKTLTKIIHNAGIK